jgi:glycosyltransferase involved in cell wall biosynthesis
MSPAEFANRTVWFYRDYQSFTGGHLKHAHYYKHTRSFPGFSTQIGFSRVDASLIEQRSQLWPGEPVQQWAPLEQDLLFLAGLDWQYLDKQKPGMLDVPKINLIQHVRHADSGSELNSFLSRKAIRLCVSQEVADAIQRTGKVNGPIKVIPNGVDVEIAEVRELDEKRSAISGKNVLIVGYKNPEFSRQLAQQLHDQNISCQLILSLQERIQFLKQLDDYEVIMCVPHETEGFYLPALETMARGKLLVTMDCIGNRGFCFSMRNCLLTNYTVEGALNSIQTALSLPTEKRNSMLNNAIETARAFSMQQETRKYQLLLQEIDELW